MTTRRNLIRAAALAPVIVALPALACNAEADPSIIAISAYRVARAAYVAACTEWATDEEINAACDVECRAAIVALSTVPTTLAGVRAFCEFGTELARESSEISGGLRDYTPGIPLRLLDVPNAEEMFFATLERAMRLLPPA
ncbi:hypothetical protein [Ancylobacter sp. TS-1]|uniref:hypothetical protein n=1 Tax=Ancylobacter sp. TS-1 TaxID=1850374 RepID=UPI001265B0F2|nr:hypothetical protein [Ancylobacter sp. TS-1]QFR34714.1 hypothetical protein GBB76_17285 [Ancylobacter sp. TS-1]